ncbi:MAG: tRNA pseudouridine(38-40) synthase TruA [Acidimicrobiales bacterium]
MTVAYDGTPFHGFAENVGVVTVAGVLRRAIERVLGHSVTLGIAGRTDTGVHAWGQVVTFDADPARLDLEVLQRALNSLCRPSIAVRDLALAEPDFHARFSATARVYRYRVYNVSPPNPFVRSTSWHVPQPLDLAALRNATIPLVGTHDFSSFCKRTRTVRPPTKEVSFVRAVRRAEWSRRGDGMVVFEIEARSFGRQMVRSIVGTLVDVGLGRRRASEVPAIIAARDRNVAGSVAPPHGLVLWLVRF